MRAVDADANFGLRLRPWSKYLRLWKWKTELDPSFFSTNIDGNPDWGDTDDYYACGVSTCSVNFVQRDFVVQILRLECARIN